MEHRINFARAFCAAGAALLLAGCGSLKLPSLSTGSIGTTTQAAWPAPAAVKPDDPVERALQVGVTIARANKCGYYFDPNQLKANYLAAEATRYPAPEIQQKVQTALEFGRVRVGRQLASQEGYCTKERTEKIKSKLTRYLAGDYTADVKKQVKQSGGLLSALETNTVPDKFDPVTIHDPYSKW